MDPPAGVPAVHWRLLTTHAVTTLALQAICHTLQGNTARQSNPHPTGSLAYAAWVCARLGGWTGYYGKPSPVVILNGLMQLNTMLRAWNIPRVV